MAKYGTIITLFDAQDSDRQTVESVLNGHSIPFLLRENSYFFKTLSKRNRDEITRQLRQANLTFLLFHNNNSDGDKIKSGNISQGEHRDIKAYLIDE